MLRPLDGAEKSSRRTFAYRLVLERLPAVWTTLRNSGE